MDINQLINSGDDVTPPPAKRQRLSPPPASFAGPTVQIPIPAATAAETKTSSIVPVSANDETEKEAKYGILTYVNIANSGFTGILKQRYTDFQVFEVGSDGKVLHLTDPEVQAENKQEKANGDQTASTVSTTSTTAALPTNGDDKSSEDAASAQPSSTNGTSGLPADGAAEDEKTFQLTDADAALLDSYFTAPVREQIVKLYEDSLNNPSGRLAPVLSEPITDKDLRTSVHRDIRRIFLGRLETQAQDGGVIKVWAKRSAADATRNKRPPREKKPQGKLGWSELGGEYVHFNLYKENRDTMEVISFISNMLKTKPKIFGTAGTKDRRAVTVQRVSAFRLKAQQLMRLNSVLFGVKLGNFTYETSPLKLGDLKGNEFVITLRDCAFSGLAELPFQQQLAEADNIVGAAVRSLQSNGFINYFGLQRFGSFLMGTHEVGMRILNGDFKGAVSAIMHYDERLLSEENQQSGQFPRDEIARAKAIHTFQTTGRTGEALDLLPRRFTAEGELIRHLGRSSTDYMGALDRIPRNLKTLYVHAYQAYVWNMVTSHRWSVHGNKVVEGDLVLIDQAADRKVETQAKDLVDENGEVVVLPAANDTALTPDQFFQRARPLSAAEAAAGKYTIFDIVLSQPGYDIEYPANEVGDYYMKFMMSAEGGGIDPSDMRRKNRDFSLSGSYRKLLARPLLEMGYEVKSYQDAEAQIVETDMQMLEKRKISVHNLSNDDKKSNDDRNASDGSSKSCTTAAAGNHAQAEAPPSIYSTEENRIAVVLKFALASSTYATMALRELSHSGIVQYTPEFRRPEEVKSKE